jgi:ABC-type amino acid transport substrate-binding protein
MDLINKNNTKKLRVGVIDDCLPYSTCKPKFKGITVEIWEETAKTHKLEYEYICYPRNYDKALLAINNDEFDVLLGEFSVISRRYNLALYTRPFYVAELYIYRKSNNSGILDSITNIDLKNVLYFVISIILIYTLLMMFILNTNFINSFYKTLLSFLTIGGEFIPTKIKKTSNNLPVKLLNTAWGIFIFFFRAFIVSRIIAASVSEKNIITNEELKQINNIHVLGDSAYVDVVKSIGKTPIEVINSDDIIKNALKEDNYYWVDDLNVVDSQIKHANVIIKLDKTERPIVNDEFTMAVNKKLPNVLDMINSTLLDMQASGDILHICKGYIDTNYDRCLL